MRILLVDQDRDFLATMADALELRGHETLVATSAAQALALARVHRPDVAVVELVLADYLDFGLIEQLRALPGGAGTPVVAISPSPVAAAEARVRGQLVTEYLPKPFPVERLALAVERAHLQQFDDLRRLRHALANLAIALEGAGESDLGKRCRAIVTALDGRITMR